MFTLGLPAVIFLDRKFKNYIYMKTIINWPGRLFNNKPRRELNFQEQICLCEKAGYRKIKSVLKKQKFDNPTLHWILVNCQNCDDKLYKVLDFYRRHHGFDDALKLFILGKRFNPVFAPLSVSIIDEYGCMIHYDGKRTTLTATAEQVLEVLNCRDEKVRRCFLKFKKLERLIADCAYVLVEREMWKNQIYFLPSACAADWSVNSCFWLPPIDEEKLRAEFYDLFPSVDEQRAIWATDNAAWIELLKDMAILILEAWESLWKNFDESLFCHRFQKMLLD